jgi:hypothetical protein
LTDNRCKPRSMIEAQALGIIAPKTMIVAAEWFEL